MKPRAIICDVYRTILEVGPPPPAVEQGWMELFQTTFGTSPATRFEDFQQSCHEAVRASHAMAKARGIVCPEVQWPGILRSVLPGFEHLPPDRRMAFQVSQQALTRTLALAPDAAPALLQWAAEGIPLGIASNAQGYTLHELGAVMAPEGLSVGLFANDLVLWSWHLGFSKPDPYFFQALSARLSARGISARDVLFIGDRMDNDILPARALGMRTWHLHPEGDGGWGRLRNQLK